MPICNKLLANINVPNFRGSLGFELICHETLVVLNHTVFYSLFAQNSLALFFSRIFSNIAIKVIMYLNPKFSLGLFEARM